MIRICYYSHKTELGFLTKTYSQQFRIEIIFFFEFRLRKKFTKFASGMNFITALIKLFECVHKRTQPSPRGQQKTQSLKFHENS